ncbi:GNAT family N-acetyltransferase [Actinophytocola sp.]|uniref:GNAT family N-acetyltransferase n=1 Tax=Actinophytocola sp. TaxID=1872138 RepID=UPI002ED0AFFB
MDVRVHQDPRTFTALAGPFYAADTLRHTVALTVMARFLGSDRKPEPIMATLHDDSGALVGAGFRTPPWPAIVSGLPTEPALLDTFIDRWLSDDPELPGVSGPRENAEALAQAWVRHTGGTVREERAMRLFRLGELTVPTTSGRARNATEHDIDLLAGWRDDSQIEIFGRLKDPASGPAVVRRMLEMGDSVVIWEDGGKPVSWAVASTPIGGMSRVGPVYTPPAHREHGYGAAVTAAVSRSAWHAGAHDVILFTDLANPTSNSIYQKIGYRQVYDSTELEFTRLPSKA